MPKRSSGALPTYSWAIVHELPLWAGREAERRERAQNARRERRGEGMDMDRDLLSMSKVTQERTGGGRRTAAPARGDQDPQNSTRKPTMTLSVLIVFFTFEPGIGPIEGCPIGPSIEFSKPCR